VKISGEIKILQERFHALSTSGRTTTWEMFLDGISKTAHYMLMKHSTLKEGYWHHNFEAAIKEATGREAVIDSFREVLKLTISGWGLKAAVDEVCQLDKGEQKKNMMFIIEAHGPTQTEIIERVIRELEDLMT